MTINMNFAVNTGLSTRESLPWPHYEEDEIEAAVKVLRSGHPNQWGGAKVNEFEREFAALAGCRHGVALANGTVALDAALKALDIGPGDDVAVSPRSFVASASCVAWAGARPVFADVDPDSQNVTAASIEAVLTPETRAAIVVHLGGTPCDMGEIMELARRRGIKIIEDCAQAHGASWDGRPVGSWGDLAAWSFCQDKIISTGGEGGMVTTNDPGLFERVWSMKDHGRSRAKALSKPDKPGFRWLVDSFGTNWRLGEMQAAIGLAQLGKLPGWLARRHRHAHIYRAEFADCPAVRLPVLPDAAGAVYYRFYAFVRPEKLPEGRDRDAVIAAAEKRGLSVMGGACSEIYREQAFVDAFGPHERLPNAKRLGETSLCFQTHHNLDEDSVRRNAAGVREIIENASKT